MSKAETFKAPVGTRDVLAPESARWEALIARFSSMVRGAGYGLVQSPVFEDIGVFQRVGEGTDVVRKEMYNFEDRSGRQLALRPEGTASIVRAFVQHRPTVPFKAWYAAPSFRYERPQAGRFRQHHQLGLEAIGSDDPELDVEVITLGWDYLTSLGLRELRLEINAMGTRDDRVGYVDYLQAWLQGRSSELDPEDQEKITSHPMRVLDSKRPATQAVVVDAPVITDRMSDASLARYEHVRASLDALEIPYVSNARLVRGLDYYTHTTFEVVSTALDAAQSTILGGGRYDGLVAEMGGPPTPGIGFGSGIERVLLACDAENVFPEPKPAVDVFVIDTTSGAQATQVVTELRRAGISADRSFDQRSMRAQMKLADRSGARIAVVIGDRELAADQVTIRQLRGHEFDSDQTNVQQSVARHGLLDAIRAHR